MYPIGTSLKVKQTGVAGMIRQKQCSCDEYFQKALEPNKNGTLFWWGVSAVSAAHCSSLWFRTSFYHGGKGGACCTGTGGGQRGATRPSAETVGSEPSTTASSTSTGRCDAACSSASSASGDSLSHPSEWTHAPWDEFGVPKWSNMECLRLIALL